ncbi:hypothetical protein O3G_MSEX002511 [Manduca sexta]|uniref:G-protein coupled receptors family 1 profile domain-containing protein n=1 Tax=Manduca sexta TaxID=7130 RepID=A0A921YPJ7_MANSE|nr:hypothetical protein O3G_MSEX002511 [Manduca sexta]KAG6442779.1 hypothetical protein O3G_MSEX002511 [Manduca sexta]
MSAPPGIDPGGTMNDLNYINGINDTVDLNTTMATLGNLTFFDLATEQQVANLLNIYYTPLLVVLGSVGNLLSVFVFYNSKLWLQPTSRYLTAVALSDTLFLTQLLPPWMNAVRLTGLFNHWGFCQVFVYLSYVTCCLSNWLVVAFTVERFMAVVYPLRRTSMCSVNRSQIIIGTLVLLAMILNLPVFRFAVPTGKNCNIDFDYLDQAAQFNVADTVLSFTIPLMVITIMNAWIMVGVWRLEHGRARPRRMLSNQRAQQRVTRMLLIVSSVFVALNLPAYTMRICAYAYNMSEKEYSGRYAALQQVALLFFNTNFGINFVLYCLSGQNFRRALREMLRWRWRQQPPAERIEMRATRASLRRGSNSTSVVSTEVSQGPSSSAVTATTPPCRHKNCPHRWIFDNRLRLTATATPRRGLFGTAVEIHDPPTPFVTPRAVPRTTPRAVPHVIPHATHATPHVTPHATPHAAPSASTTSATSPGRASS